MATHYLHGFHDQGGEHLHQGKPGWTVISEEVGIDAKAKGKDYSAIANQGIRVLVRLNYSHQGQGTLPRPTEYLAFAAACASFVASSKGVWGWIIGNEPNHEGERPNGVVIWPEDYARAFKLCREAIKRVHSSHRVGPAGMAPYHANPTKWHLYLATVLRLLAETGGCDFLVCHAYTRGMDASRIGSQAKMGAPLEDTYSGFLTYRDFAAQVPDALLYLPAIITEFDAYLDWKNEDTGVITAAYDEINTWNSWQDALPKFWGMTCFRWLGPPDVGQAHDWEMRNKPNLLADFADVVTIGYKSPEGENSPQSDIFIPIVTAPEPPMTPTVERHFTGRFLERTRNELDFADPKAQEVYYALVKADYYPPPEGARTFGPDHHILVEVLDENGNREMGAPVHFLAGSDNIRKVVDKQGGPYGVDFNMASPGYGYGVYVGDVDRLSDIAQGMGLGTTEQPDWAHHVVFHLTYQKKRALASAPPPPPITQPVEMPTLLHPVADPAKRMVTQRFGARPEYYGQFRIDDVRLKGHEGLDFGTGTGAAIVAVDEGIATEVVQEGSHPYGTYVKIIHPWGESVYGHLSQTMVAPRSFVARGQVIGLSGWSGNVEPKGPGGAHLHFGLRKNPYNRRDGWGGYIDPAPYLINVEQPSTPPTQPPPGELSKKEIVTIIERAAQDYGVDKWLLLSLIHAESSLVPSKVNPISGAKGLGQIMPLTWGDFAPQVGARDIFNAVDNARVTAKYLDWCIEQMGGKERQGLWAYIMGPTGARDAIAKNKIPVDVQHYASKIIHGKEVIQWSLL